MPPLPSPAGSVASFARGPSHEALLASIAKKLSSQLSGGLSDHTHPPLVKSAHANSLAVSKGRRIQR